MPLCFCQMGKDLNVVRIGIDGKLSKFQFQVVAATNLHFRGEFGRCPAGQFVITLIQLSLDEFPRELSCVLQLVRFNPVQNRLEFPFPSLKALVGTRCGRISLR